MVKKIKEIFRREGFSGIFMRVKERLYLKTYIYQASIPATDADMEKYAFTAVPLTAEIVAAIEQEHASEFPVGKKGQFFKTLRPESTDKVYVVMDCSGRVMNYSCISFADNYEPRMRYTIESIADNIYIYDCYTFTQHRNKGVQKFSILSLFKEARKIDYKTATCMIDEGNTFSEKAFMTLGFKRIGYVKTYNLCFFKMNTSSIFK